MTGLQLTVLPGVLAVCRMAADAPIPAWATSGPFTCITRTGDELSVVCAAECVPHEATAERSWACLKVAGPLDFALTGVLAGLAAPLADVGIPIFVVSTYDTDYLLVKEKCLQTAINALEEAGNQITKELS